MANRWWPLSGLGLVLAVLGGCGSAEPASPAPVGEVAAAVTVDEARIENLLGQMTLEEKVVLVHGNSFTGIAGIPRLGIKSLSMVDGPMGIRYPINGSVAMPSETEMASTFNPDLIEKAAAALGQETAASKFNMLLGPGVNIIRTPIGGRSFEYFSEDPLLTAKMGAAYVRGLQSQNVIATVKHYALNSVEQDRQSYSSEADERTIREIYLPGFKAAVDAGALAFMAGYNRVNGTYSTEHQWLLNDVLKKEWGYKGLVMSDWWAIHSTVPAALAGLDVDMPGDSKLFEAPLIAAVGSGAVSLDVVNDKARRVLRAMAFVGDLDTPPAATVDAAANGATARSVAEEGIVLLKNARAVLPLDPSRLKTVAVIGPNADKKLASGRWSGEIPARYEITPLAGIKQRLGTSVTIRQALGDPAPVPASSFQNLKVECFASKDLSGAVGWTAAATAIDVNFNSASPGGTVPATNFSCRWTGTLVLGGATLLGLNSDDGSRVFVDDQLVLDYWSDHSTGIKLASTAVAAGTHTVRVEYYQGTGGAEVHLLSASSSDAIAAAKGADVALVFVGTDRGIDMEGADKPDLHTLPGHDALVSAIAAANPNTVVVLTNGSAVEMPWVAEVPAIVEAWYSGMEAGTAIANVLFGDVNPSGKLTMTFPKKLLDSPAHANGNYPPQGGVLKFDEGILVGYRYFDTKKVEPLFPFGHGLSYTTFEYQSLRVKSQGNNVFTVSVTVRNTGARDGKEVVELYVRPTKSSEARPDKELKGFQKIALKAGETADATIALDASAFQFWSAKSKAWVIEPGVFQILVGSSSRDLRLSYDLDLANPPDAGTGQAIDSGAVVPGFDPGTGGSAGAAGSATGGAGGSAGTGGAAGVAGGVAAAGGASAGAGASPVVAAGGSVVAPPAGAAPLESSGSCAMSRPGAGLRAGFAEMLALLAGAALLKRRGSERRAT